MMCRSFSRRFIDALWLLWLLLVVVAFVRSDEDSLTGLQERLDSIRNGASPKAMAAADLLSDMLKTLSKYGGDFVKPERYDRDNTKDGGEVTRIPLRIDLILVGFGKSGTSTNSFAGMSSFFEQLQGHFPHIFLGDRKDESKVTSTDIEYDFQYHVIDMGDRVLAAIETGLSYLMRDEDKLSEGATGLKYVSSWNMESLLSPLLYSLRELNMEFKEIKRGSNHYREGAPASFTLFLLNPTRTSLPDCRGYGYRWGLSSTDLREALSSDPSLLDQAQEAKDNEFVPWRTIVEDYSVVQQAADSDKYLHSKDKWTYVAEKGVLNGPLSTVTWLDGRGQSNRWADSVLRKLKSRTSLVSPAEELRRLMSPSFVEEGAPAELLQPSVSSLGRRSLLRSILYDSISTGGSACLGEMGIASSDRFAWVDVQAGPFHWGPVGNEGAAKQSKSPSMVPRMPPAGSHLWQRNIDLSADLIHLQQLANEKLVYLRALWSRYDCLSRVSTDCAAIAEQSSILESMVRDEETLAAFSLGSPGADIDFSPRILQELIGVYVALLERVWGLIPPLQTGEVRDSTVGPMGPSRTLPPHLPIAKLSSIVSSLVRTVIVAPSSLQSPMAAGVDDKESFDVTREGIRLPEGISLLSSAILTHHSPPPAPRTNCMDLIIPSRLEYTLLIVRQQVDSAALDFDVTSLQYALLDVHLPGQEVSLSVHDLDASADPALATALAAGLKVRSFSGEHHREHRRYLDSDEIYMHLKGVDTSSGRQDGIPQDFDGDHKSQSIAVIVFVFDDGEPVFVDELYAARAVGGSMVVAVHSPASALPCLFTCGNENSNDAFTGMQTHLHSTRDIIAAVAEAAGGLVALHSPLWGSNGFAYNWLWALSSSALSPLAHPAITQLSLVDKDNMVRSTAAVAIISARQLAKSAMRIMRSVSSANAVLPAAVSGLLDIAAERETAVLHAVSMVDLKSAVDLLNPLLSASRGVYAAATEHAETVRANACSAKAGRRQPLFDTPTHHEALELLKAVSITFMSAVIFIASFTLLKPKANRPRLKVNL
jgi:hypothetical protein